MPFFEDTKVETLAERHIRQVRDLEEEAAAKLRKSVMNVRSELLNRLATVEDTTFTAQQLRVTLVQVEAILAALNDILTDEMASEAETLGIAGVGDLIEEIEEFSEHFEGTVQPINLNAALIAQNTNNFLINRYEASVKNYTSGLREQITRGLNESIIARDNFSRVQFKLNRFFNQEEFKLDRIIRTELHNVYNLGKLEGMRRTKEEVIPDLKKALFHPMDSRTAEDSKKLAELDLKVPIDKPFKFRWKGQERVFMVPPDRPNDRSILIPYRNEWDS